MDLRTKIVLSDSSQLLFRSFLSNDMFAVRRMYSALSEETKDLFHPTFLQKGSDWTWSREETLVILCGNRVFRTILMRMFPRAVYLTLLVLNSEQEIVALSFYKIKGRLDKGQFEAENGMAVREDYQGKGLGFKLFILGNRFARQNRIRKVCSIVSCMNERMINLNKKLGLKIDRTVTMKNLRTFENYQAFEMSLFMP